MSVFFNRKVRLYNVKLTEPQALALRDFCAAAQHPEVDPWSGMYAALTPLHRAFASITAEIDRLIAIGPDKQRSERGRFRDPLVVHQREEVDARG